jgi:flagellar motor switch protein FliG
MPPTGEESLSENKGESLMEMADDEIKSLIKNALPEIKETMLEEMKRSLAWSVGNQLSEHTKTTVEKFVKEEISPEMAKYLQEQKPAILASVLESLDGIIKEVSLAIVSKAKSNLAQGYQRDRIVEAIFK